MIGYSEKNCSQKTIKSRNLFYLQLHINNKCNLRCAHCYERGLEHKVINLLKPNEIFEIIEKFQSFVKGFGWKGKIYFTGGEPLLDPNLYDYISSARNLGLVTMILSNGTLITEYKVRKLVGAGLNIAQISIDGLESSHDLIRGPGSFKKATKGIEECSKAGLFTTIMTTLGRWNSKDIEGIVRHAILHGANEFSFGRLVPEGNGILLKDQILSKDELKQVFKKIKKINKKYGKFIRFALHDPLWTTYCGENVTHGCSAGISGICVVENGDVMPCRRLNSVIGNIKTDTFETLWNSPCMIAFRNRDDYEGKCGNCKHITTCGGCRAIAKALTNSEFGEDLQCFLRS
ncbi:MAG: radical SAM protein [Candidatus Lokiarchaeota archaeon]|nr:radical SAM protein [Candidatus Lokiarchaeota archaeon]